MSSQRIRRASREVPLIGSIGLEADARSQDGGLRRGHLTCLSREEPPSREEPKAGEPRRYRTC